MLEAQLRKKEADSPSTATWAMGLRVRERRYRAPDVLLGSRKYSTPVDILVERFDIEPLSDFSAKWSNLRGLVLFSIDAKFCKKIVVGKLLTRSTIFTCFCTAQISIFQQNFVKLVLICVQLFLQKTLFSSNFTQILMKCSRNFTSIFSKQILKRNFEKFRIRRQAVILVNFLFT